MGDTKHVNLSLTKEQHTLGLEVKNGESWEDFFMRLIREEKQRKDNF